MQEQLKLSGKTQAFLTSSEEPSLKVWFLLFIIFWKLIIKHIRTPISFDCVVGMMIFLAHIPSLFMWHVDINLFWIPTFSGIEPGESFYVMSVSTIFLLEVMIPVSMKIAG